MPSVASLDTPLPGSLEEAQQRYEVTKKALKSGISKKRHIDRTLTDLESQIFLFEGSYLSNTAASGGNIVKGFDSYLKTNAATGGSSKLSSINTSILGGQEIAPDDRMFSISSATYKRSLELKANESRLREESPAVNRKDKDRDSVQKDKEKESTKQLKRKERESLGNTSNAGAGEGGGKGHKKKRKEEE